MGCANSQHFKEEQDDSTWAEWSKVYERRIAEALGENEVTRADAAAMAPSQINQPQADCTQEKVDQPLSQTIFFFDWDDTLFPTTWARKKLGTAFGTTTSLKKAHQERFEDVSSRLVGLLSEAQTIGKVVIVTNASRSWMAKCCDMLMPEAKTLLQGIPLIYAMELLTSCETAKLPENLIYTESKTRAIRAILSTFHRSHSGFRGWLNVVSVGDSICERIANREIARNKQLGQGASTCFTKTIKMQGHPSLMQMLLQLSVISKWFSQIVHLATHVNIDFGKHA